MPAYVLETLAYAITSVYNIRNAFPFSTYGENLFLTIQNIIITFLIIYYPTPLRRSSGSNSSSTTTSLFIAVLGMAVSAFALYVVPNETLALFQFGTLPLTLFSKLPQIGQNAKAKSTGQLSTFAVGAQILGCLARLFTTATETGDIILTLGFALALALNVVLGVQMYMYWGREGYGGEESVLGRPAGGPVPIRSEKDWSAALQEKVDIVVPPQSPAVGPTGRKWSRKID